MPQLPAVGNSCKCDCKKIDPPVITSAGSASGEAKKAFSYTITATNSPTSYNATGLPAGLNINTSNGVISGTPTTAGTYTITISAKNDGGTGTKTLTLTVAAAVIPATWLRIQATFDLGGLSAMARLSSVAGQYAGAEAVSNGYRDCMQTSLLNNSTYIKFTGYTPAWTITWLNGRTFYDSERYSGNLAFTADAALYKEVQLGGYPNYSCSYLWDINVALWRQYNPTVQFMNGTIPGIWRHDAGNYGNPSLGNFNIWSAFYTAAPLTGYDNPNGIRQPNASASWIRGTEKSFGVPSGWWSGKGSWCYYFVYARNFSFSGNNTAAFSIDTWNSTYTLS